LRSEVAFSRIRGLRSEGENGGDNFAAVELVEYEAAVGEFRGITTTKENAIVHLTEHRLIVVPPRAAKLFRNVKVGARIEMMCTDDVANPIRVRAIR
jgi:hypothetical protein